MNSPASENQPIVCDLSAVPVADRQRLMAAVPPLFQAVQEVHELPNGYAFGFPHEPGRFMALAQFVDNERLCCPFYNFVLEVEPSGGPFWLRMTGGEGVKQFLETVFSDLHGAVRNELIRPEPGDHLDEVVAHAAPVLAATLGKALNNPQGRQ
jgi:hypothetical protein